jgi:excisionase family DNA binding protein
METNEKTISAAKAAKILDVSPSTLLKWLWMGLLPGEKDGKSWKIKVSDLESFKRPHEPIR